MIDQFDDIPYLTRDNTWYINDYYAFIFGSDPEPKPVKAQTFDEWLKKTTDLLDECQREKR